MKYRNKEISWLSFNGRVLQEAGDRSVPLMERMKFLGIFSNNLDEFFRVRVATLKRLERLGKKAEKIIGHRPSDILEEIHRIVLSQQADFDNIYQEILQELAREKIFLINENQLEDEQAEFVRQYFRNEVRPALIPIMLDQLDEFPELRDHAIYLVITLMQENQPQTLRYALIELPT
ncbi:MAG: polyphosphate kinase 1, partial [Calditrichaeota bacterium]|nr:polyphosphate kinase 1 [Calditrichota bacterium]